MLYAAKIDNVQRDSLLGIDPVGDDFWGEPGRYRIEIVIVTKLCSWHNHLALVVLDCAAVVSLPVADTPNELRLARVRAYEQPSAE